MFCTIWVHPLPGAAAAQTDHITARTVVQNRMTIFIAEPLPDSGSRIVRPPKQLPLAQLHQQHAGETNPPGAAARSRSITQDYYRLQLPIVEAKRNQPDGNYRAQHLIRVRFLWGIN